MKLHSWKWLLITCSAISLIACGSAEDTNGIEVPSSGNSPTLTSPNNSDATVASNSMSGGVPPSGSLLDDVNLSNAAAAGSGGGLLSGLGGGGDGGGLLSGLGSGDGGGLFSNLGGGSGGATGGGLFSNLRERREANGGGILSRIRNR